MKKHYSIKKNIDANGYWTAYAMGWIIVDENGEEWGGRGFYKTRKQAQFVADALNRANA